jgi:hypothetical protein
VPHVLSCEAQHDTACSREIATGLSAERPVQARRVAALCWIMTYTLPYPVCLHTRVTSCTLQHVAACKPGLTGPLAYLLLPHAPSSGTSFTSPSPFFTKALCRHFIVLRYFFEQCRCCYCRCCCTLCHSNLTISPSTAISSAFAAAHHLSRFPPTAAAAAAAAAAVSAAAAAAAAAVFEALRVPPLLAALLLPCRSSRAVVRPLSGA